MRLSNSKIYGLLGLAKRAGKAVSGAYNAEKAIRDGKLCLLILAEDASENSRKKFNDKCRYYEVPLFTLGSKEELGQAVGEEERVCVGICDQGLAQAVITICRTSETLGIRKQGE